MFRKWIIQLALDIYKAWEAERWFIKPKALLDAKEKMFKMGRTDLLCEDQFVQETTNLIKS